MFGSNLTWKFKKLSRIIEIGINSFRKGHKGFSKDRKDNIKNTAKI